MERQKIKCLLRVATHCLKKCARGWPPPFLCLLSHSLGRAGSPVQPRPLGSTSVLQEICLAGTCLACACHKIYWRVSVSTKHFVFRRFLFFFHWLWLGNIISMASAGVQSIQVVRLTQWVWLSVSRGCKPLLCFCSPGVAGNYRCKTVQATRPRFATKDVPTNPAACWNSWVHVPICGWQLGSCNTHVQLAAKLWIQISHFCEVSKHKRLLSFSSFWAVALTTNWV